MIALDDKRAEFVELRESGMAVPQISKKLGVPVGTAYGWNYKLKRGRLKHTGKRALKRRVATGGNKDVLLYLRAAVADIERRTRSGELRRRDRAHLLTELALSELEAELLHKIE